MFNPKIIASLISMGLIGFFPLSSLAQQTIGQKEPDPFQSNEKSPIYGDGINPMDLIHNANLMNRRTGADFAEDINDNIDQAADDFRKEQLQKMMEQRQQNTQNITAEESDSP